MYSLTNPKRILCAKLNNVYLVLKPVNVRKKEYFQAEHVLLELFQADTLCASVLLFYSHIRTEQYVAGDWYARPCLKGWFDILWHSFIFVLTFWFIMQKVSSRLLESADRKRKRERVTSQGVWMLMCCHMSRVLRCTEAEVWGKIVNTAGFQRGWFRVRYCWEFAIERDGKKRKVTHTVMFAG